MTDNSSSKALPTAGPAAPAPAPPRKEAADDGFALQFDKTSLWDLVQFECLRRSQRILRVRSKGHAGFIYFRAGQIVHANTLRSAGEAAVREMLGWKSGSVEPWTGPWPERETITISWQSLLLGAAESLPTPAVVPVAASQAAPPPAPPTVTAALPPAPPPLPPAEPPVEVVLLAPNGRVLRGSPARGLAEAAAYAAQMADLIGEFLGLEAFQVLDASFERLHYRLSRTRDGAILAERGSDPGRFSGGTAVTPGSEVSP